MAVSRKHSRELLKQDYLVKVVNFFESLDEEVLQIKSNEIAFPVVDNDGNEDFIKITISIPTGSNKGTEPFDAYSLAEEFQMKQKQKEEKKRESEEKKKIKIEKDKKRREKEKQIHKSE